MSTSWKGLRRKIKPSPSISAEAYGVKAPVGLEEKVRQLADTLIVNDLKEEYYYSQLDVAIDAFRIHREFADKHPELYKEVLKTLKPITLECQKVLAAIYLWDRRIDRDFALELIKDVRPSWKITFFYVFKTRLDELCLRHKGWGRSLRKLAAKLIEGLSPYQLIKYKAKLISLARWCHLKPSSPNAQYLFRDYRKDEGIKQRLREADKLWLEIFELKEMLSKPTELAEIESFLKQVNIPFTVLKGMLGSLINEPEVFKSIIHTMTTWEAILSLKQLEKRGLLADKRVFDFLKEKLSPERLKELRIDIVELLQAFRKVRTKEAEELLKSVLRHQISSVAERLNPYLEGRRVVVVFDLSGSMHWVSDWSMGLALTLSQVKAKELKLVAFADEAITLPFPNVDDMLLGAFKKIRVGGGTALGKGLIEALKHEPDIIFFISDFEGNIEPWSDKVYGEYVKVRKSFPDVISIKFVTSPLTAPGEITALRLGRWLGIPKEQKIILRNIWDLPTILEYVLNLLPILMKRAKETSTYIA